MAVSPGQGDDDFMHAEYLASVTQIAEEEALIHTLQISLVEAESLISRRLDIPQVHEDIGAPAPQSSNSAEFGCGVCMDNYREEIVTRLSDCQHVFCEDCLKRTVQADLQSRKFPVLCPACVADRGTEVPS
ncbi:hypothetical protein C0992_006978, partial [Termitomyces sp. T32_za158]